MEKTTLLRRALLRNVKELNSHFSYLSFNQRNRKLSCVVFSKASQRYLLEVHDKFEQASTMEARHRGIIKKWSKVNQCFAKGYEPHTEIITMRAWRVLGFLYLFINLFNYLEANYFTILYWFLSYIDMNHPWIYMYSPSRSPLTPLSSPDPSGSSQCTRSEHFSHESTLGWWSVST